MLGIILAVVYTAIFIFLFQKINFFRIENIPLKFISLVFILKIISGTAMWFVYSHIYSDHLTADIFKYFDDGEIMYNALFSKPLDYFKMLFGFQDSSLEHYFIAMRHWSRNYNMGLYNENRTMIRFNALVDIFSFGNFHVHTVFMSFLSLIGLVGIYKTFLPFLSDKKKELFVVVFLMPSVLFWSSGVLKEGLVIFSMGMLIYHSFKFLNEKFSVKRSLMIFFFSFLLFITKMYVLLCVLPALFAYALLAKTNYRFAEIKYLFVIILYFSIGLMIPKYNFPYMLMDKQRQTFYLSTGGSYLGNFREKRYVYISPKIENRIIRLKEQPGFCKIVPGVAYISVRMRTNTDTQYVEHSTDTTTYWIYNDQIEAGSRINIPFIEPNFFNIVENSPRAFFTTLFRPHLLEAKNVLTLFSAIENCFIAIFMLVCLIFCSKKMQNRHVIYFCSTIFIFLFTLIGITTPVLGAIVRYKVPALPFLLIAFLLILDKEKLLAKFPFLKKILT